MLSISIILIIVFAIGNPRFISVRNYINLCRQLAPIIIVGCPMTFMIVSGSIDLSVGSVLGLSSVVLAFFCIWGFNLPIALLMLFIMGIIIGMINGVLTEKLLIPAIIVTIATMTVIRGLAYTICGAIPVAGAAIKSTKVLYSTIFFEDSFPIPIPLIYILVTMAIFIFLEKKTILGKYSLAMGGNMVAARLSGINVTRIRLVLFILTSVMACFAGAVATGSMIQGEPNNGIGFEFSVLVACVLGGTSIKGGEGSIVGMLGGALITVLLDNGMNMLNIQSFFQMVVKGSVLLIAILIYTLTRQRLKKA